MGLAGFETDQGKKFELCFPGEVLYLRVCALNGAKAAAGPLAPVLAIDLAEQFVTTSGDEIV